MKANGRFFGFMFIFNMIFALIGFLILWGIFALTESIVGIVICGCIWISIADYFNLFVVKKSKLKTPYVLFGSAVNLIFIAVPTVLVVLL